MRRVSCTARLFSCSSCAFLWLTGAHVPVQVFRILILSEVGQHAAGAVFREHFFCYFTNDSKQFEQELVVTFFEREKRRDVALGDDDNVYRPEGACVVVRENVAGFANDLNWRPPA